MLWVIMFGLREAVIQLYIDLKGAREISAFFHAFLSCFSLSCAIISALKMSPTRVRTADDSMPQEAQHD